MPRLRSALGDPKAIAPFFRIPGLLRQNSVEQYLAAHNYMTWSVDFAADDWTHINAQEITRRAISRIEARGKGILLLHDIQPATALAFPEILKELKARGFKIVHVVPATPDRPKTVTEPEQWAARHTPEPKIWPRTLVTGESPEPVLAAPSPASFGIEKFGPVTKVAMAQTFERKVVSDGAPRCRSCPVAPPGGLLRYRRMPMCCPCRERTISSIPAYSDWGHPTNRRWQPRSPRRPSQPRRSRPTACSDQRRRPVRAPSVTS